MYYLKKMQNIVIKIYVKMEDMGITVSSIVFLHSKSCAIKTTREHKKFGKHRVVLSKPQCNIKSLEHKKGTC
jgi:hypothetical protein